MEVIKENSHSYLGSERVKITDTSLHYVMVSRTEGSFSIYYLQVPFLPIFADKLASLGINNFGLFLVNENGTCKSYLYSLEL